LPLDRICVAVVLNFPVLAPLDDRVEVEAVLENREIGFRPGRPARRTQRRRASFMQDGLFCGTVMSIDGDAEAAPVNANGVQGATRQADEIDRVKASERLRYTVHHHRARQTRCRPQPRRPIAGHVGEGGNPYPQAPHDRFPCWRRCASMSTHAMRERS
jgi:hypothetical protein